MAIDFIFTKYFYPIDVNSEQKFFDGIYFDNPRTKEEIAYAARYLKHLNLNGEHGAFPEENTPKFAGCVTLRLALENFIENNISKDGLFRKYKKYLKLKNIYYALAHFLVIVRCDKIINQNDVDKALIFVMEGAKDTEVPNSLYNFDQIRKYFTLIDFLVFAEGSLFSPIVMAVQGISYDAEHVFFQTLSNFTCIAFSPVKEENDFDYEFQLLQARYKKAIILIGDKYKDEKTLFICDLLENICDLQAKNPNMYLLGIVSLLELLLTHKPDSQRFNIEESISKQYQNKLAFLLYENNKNLDLEKLKKELKYSYAIRSDIAHGNFGKERNKNLKALFDFYGMKEGGKNVEYEDYETALDYLNEHLTHYAQIILIEYFKDCERIRLLKEI